MPKKSKERSAKGSSAQGKRARHVPGLGAEQFIMTRQPLDEINRTWEFGDVLDSLKEGAPQQTYYNQDHPLIKWNVADIIMQAIAGFLGEPYSIGINAISGSGEHGSNSLEQVTVTRKLLDKFKSECRYNASALLSGPLSVHAQEAYMVAVYMWHGFLRIQFVVQHLGGPRGQSWEWLRSGQEIWDKAKSRSVKGGNR